MNLELLEALNYLSGVSGAKEAVVSLAKLGRQDPERLAEIIRYIKLKTK